MSTRVRIPTPLRSYTRGKDEVTAEGATLDEVSRSLEASFPGIRFRIIDEQDRIRRHIKLFVREEDAKDLDHPVREGDTVTIICALSGGGSPRAG